MRLIVAAAFAAGCAPEDLDAWGPLYSEHEIAELAGGAEPSDARDVVYQGAWADYFETVDLFAGTRSVMGAHFDDALEAEPYAELFDLWRWDADGTGTGIAFLPAWFNEEQEWVLSNPSDLPWITVLSGARNDEEEGDAWLDRYFTVLQDLAGTPVAVLEIERYPDLFALEPDLSAHRLSPELLAAQVVDGASLVRGQ